ncbi:hypothetical protein BCR44DRAFT_1433167 [Catenaria anguillulae PL171]|uniref:Uncharacterized protein n=1 Tax=Catenaria anguillulae PL171 TaxID=765915 RepID=A0A1Y2HQ43_9FUNG|nr:hypothetical protein BCR44DRAFT_1433167 [Catenaria anguillulae PL171]
MPTKTGPCSSLCMPTNLVLLWVRSSLSKVKPCHALCPSSFFLRQYPCMATLHPKKYKITSFDSYVCLSPPTYVNHETKKAKMETK